MAAHVESLNRPRRSPKAPNSRAGSTRTGLLEAAETLFGEDGIEAVSMRQIGLAIGSANTNVVTYHFGTKDDLVLAVLRYRLAAIEGRRAELLAQSGLPLDQLQPPALLDILYRPLFEQRNAHGQHSYAKFLASLFRSKLFALRGAMHGEFLVTMAISDRLKACMAEGAERFFEQRMHMVSQVLASGLQAIDRDGADALSAEDIFADTLRSIAGLLLAPGA